MSRHTSALVAVSLASLLALAGCASDSSAGEQDEAAENGTRTVATDQGEVKIPADPQNVVVLNYALGGYAFDLDLPISGITQEDFDYDAKFDENWADQAEEQGTEFVPWGVDGFDAEAILALEPDLILAGGLGMPAMLAGEQYDELSEIAPTVIVSNQLTTWEEQYSFIADDVFGEPEVYEEALADYEARVDEVAEAITPPEGESAFLTMTPDGGTFVLIESMGMPQVFESLGFEPAPIYEEGDYEPYAAGGDMFELSTEQVGQVITQENVFVTGFNTDIGTIEDVAENPVFASLPAFESGNAHMLPHWMLRGDYHDTLELLDEIEKLYS